ncbi:polysaccharide biosynthesis tyrosine autokinase [Brachybacterium vulturis]|uniref:polysaccharide biosynthesis tyrosine autokinase n=1 Tax=Brachybacterium vulturis TaxID=2017484 RepID=UPI00156038AA|nr:polysaccharide biosynthesis tyrosine autokinase [Brachybacterium vulturis]
MEIQQYLAVLRKRWLSALLTALLILLAAALVTLLQTPRYEATNRLFIQTLTESSIAELNGGVDFASQQITTYADLATSPMVLDPVIEELALDKTSRELAEDINTSIPPDTLILEITVTSTTPDLAADIANSTAASLRAVVAELSTTTSGSTVKLTVVSTADAPSAPASPSVPRNIALGLLLGIMAGFAVAVAQELSDNRVRTTEDVEKSVAMPVIGSVQAVRDSEQAPLVMSDRPHSVEAEAYRELRTNLRFTGLNAASNSILVTSSLANEGKSSSAINLAHVLAQAGNCVLLIEADLRRPSLSRYLGLEATVGLTTVLIGEADLSEVTQPLETPGLEVLTAGPIPPNPSEMLGSIAMQRTLDTAMAAYDYVVIDSPPLLSVTDTAVLSRIVGGTLIVARSGLVRKPQLRAALEKLTTIDSDVLGVLLNRVPRRAHDVYTQRYQYAIDSESSVAMAARAETLALLREATSPRQELQPADTSSSRESSSLGDRRAETSEPLAKTLSRETESTGSRG